MPQVLSFSSLNNFRNEIYHEKPAGFQGAESFPQYTQPVIYHVYAKPLVVHQAPLLGNLQ